MRIGRLLRRQRTVQANCLGCRAQWAGAAKAAKPGSFLSETQRLMPLYYFHVRTERGLFLDDDGIDLPNFAAVRLEALTSAHEFLAEAEWSGPLAFQVTDQRGRTVLTLPIQAISLGWPAHTSSTLTQGYAALH